jgi:hypothetical protein
VEVSQATEGTELRATAIFGDSIIAKGILDRQLELDPSKAHANLSMNKGSARSMRRLDGRV